MDGEHTARLTSYILVGNVGVETGTQLDIDSSCVPVSALL